MILFLGSNDQTFYLYIFKDAELFILWLNYLFFFKKLWENKGKTNELTEIPKRFPAQLLFHILFPRKSLFKVSIYSDSVIWACEAYLSFICQLPPLKSKALPGGQTCCAALLHISHLQLSSSSWRSQWFVLSGGSAVLLLPRLAKRLFPFDEILAESSLSAGSSWAPPLLC